MIMATRDKWIAVVLAVALLIGGSWLYQRFGTASIEITTTPAGALVHLDGRRVGMTPMVTRVAAGRHLLLLEHSHYETLRESISLDRGDHIARDFQFSVGTGTLRLLSSPTGAWVEIDGERLAQQTPTQLTTPAGEISIRMGVSEHLPAQKQVVLKTGATLEVNLDLNIDLHGSLTVLTTPRDAKIEIPAIDVDYKPGVRVPVGERLIRVSRSGYATQEVRFRVLDGENQTRVKLTRLYGKLNVRVQPDEAEVFVSYRGDDDRQVREAYRPGMSVPVGRVEVRARSLGFRTAYAEFLISQSGHTVRLTLSTIDVSPGRRFQDPLKNGNAGPVMVVIPAGSFTMGDATGNPSEQPAHKVTLTQPFALSVSEVSIASFAEFARSADVEMSSRLAEAETDEPMRFVSWYQAQTYVTWLTQQTGFKYRLPTEAEWEYAARAGSQGAYFFGDDPSRLCEFANVADLSAKEIYAGWDVVDCRDGYQKIAPVASFAANPFGLHDIYGNVSEWIADCGINSYSDAPSDGSIDQRGGCGSHGFRGGSWDSQAAEMRSAYRNTAVMANGDRGIRLLREL